MAKGADVTYYKKLAKYQFMVIVRVRDRVRKVFFTFKWT